MTAIAADRDAGGAPGDLVTVGVAANAAIYKDTMVMYDSLGYLTSMTDASGNVFAGVAYEAATGSDTSGNVKCRVKRKESYEFVLSGASITMLGDLVYAADNQTIKTTAGDSTCVGRACAFRTAGKLYVDIGGYC